MRNGDFSATASAVGYSGGSTISMSKLIQRLVDFKSFFM